LYCNFVKKFLKKKFFFDLFLKIFVWHLMSAYYFEKKKFFFYLIEIQAIAKTKKQPPEIQQNIKIIFLLMYFYAISIKKSIMEVYQKCMNKNVYEYQFSVNIIQYMFHGFEYY
jgi:hypothetical protein